MEVTRNPENGKFRFASMTETEYIQMKDDTGICLGCDNAQMPVEPDARRVTCEACGKPFVYGVEELLVMGRIQITAAATEEAIHIG